MAELTWLQVAGAAVGALVVPLILHRIFFYKKVDHESSAGSESLEDYMSKALGDMDQDVAKQQYVEWVQDLFEEFDVRGPKRWRSSSGPSAGKATSESVSLENSVSMAGPVSMPKVDMYAIFGGSLRILRSTEEWKVKEDVFHFASTGNVEKLTAALAQGADIDAQDADGMTPLHYAASCEHEEMARLLVSNVTHWPAGGELMLSLCAPLSSQVEHGALVDVEDHDGDTPLTTASSQELQSILADGPTSDLQ
ncbi:hypothetical protein BBJ28_00001976 [Nothophytophthora sp. Chile5]|nr:hypothetical protein BBJ28_00001976 [Nothophytophthora sp. Chile5]